LRSPIAIGAVSLARGAASPAARAQSDSIGVWMGWARGQPTPAPEVRITIGTVEVHAIPPRPSSPSPAPQRPSAARRPGTSLAEYLGKRAGRSS
jgi:hypothetical protein